MSHVLITTSSSSSQDGVDGVLKLARSVSHADNDGATHELVDDFGRAFQGKLVHLGAVALGRFGL
jgi:hypothetical protein